MLNNIIEKGDYYGPIFIEIEDICDEKVNYYQFPVPLHVDISISKPYAILQFYKNNNTSFNLALYYKIVKHRGFLSTKDISNIIYENAQKLMLLPELNYDKYYPCLLNYITLLEWKREF